MLTSLDIARGENYWIHIELEISLEKMAKKRIYQGVQKKCMHILSAVNSVSHKG